MSAKTEKSEKKVESITISPPNFITVKVPIVGTAPYMQARFSAKAMQQMMAKMELGTTSNKNKNRKPRDFNDDFVQAQHISTDGWNGIPASAFRAACIDACRAANFKMTHAKISIFIVGDGVDKIDAIPLVKLTAKKPERIDMAVRNASGVADIRVRPIWREWGATLSIRFDGDQFTIADVLNLLERAGMQIGVGEGRPFSRESNGLNLGTFRINRGDIQVVKMAA